MKINLLRNSKQIVSQIKSQYAEHLSALKTPISLHELFSNEHFNLRDYCNSFRPHHHATTLTKSVAEFGKNYNIWLKNAEHYITCAIYLFPSAHIYRMLPVLKNCAIDFYLNDTIGREVFPGLTPDQQLNASNIIRRMSTEIGTFNLPDDASPVEHANREMMLDIKETSPSFWFNNFLMLYTHHIEITHRNCNTDHVGAIPTIDEYIQHRCHVSGMHHTIALIEYCGGQFLDWNWLTEHGIATDLKRLQFIVAAIGCLMNDLFSFEKEVIVSESDHNLLMVIALNQPELSLTEIIDKSSLMVKELLSEFIELIEIIRAKSYTLLPLCTSCVDILENHLTGLENCVQASWVWQVSTKRYKRPVSIWEETQLRVVNVNA
jgi:hypothetical protein